MLQSLGSVAPRRALAALAKLLQDPDDLPQVFTVIEALSGPAIAYNTRRLRGTERGARLLRERPDITTLLRDRAALACLPEGSLGRAYLAFMEAEGISVEGIVAASKEGRDEARDGDTPEQAYFRQRMRDTHDLWHAVTGYRGDVVGELALLGFLLAQVKNPAIGLIVLGGLFKTRDLAEARRLILDGFRRGARAAWLPDTDWEALLALPVDEVRARLGVDAPPVYTPMRTADLRARAQA
jgi:ubiquinone biosynthesis protein COQ4